MKGTYFLTVAALALMVAMAFADDQVPTSCPLMDGDRPVHLAHEKDCSKFYMCNEGEKVLKQCPKSENGKIQLYFNAKLQVCDWPESSGCKNK